MTFRRCLHNAIVKATIMIRNSARSKRCYTKFTQRNYKEIDLIILKTMDRSLSVGRSLTGRFADLLRPTGAIHVLRYPWHIPFTEYLRLQLIWVLLNTDSLFSGRLPGLPKSLKLTAYLVSQFVSLFCYWQYQFRGGSLKTNLFFYGKTPSVINQHSV